ncbi:MAG: helix-turn-helix domain-containing protein [Terriglobia bacterium]
MTVNELARLGGLARSKAHTKYEIAAWGRKGGRPRKLIKADLRKLSQWREKGLLRAQMAKRLGVSIATVWRALALMRQGD